MKIAVFHNYLDNIGGAEIVALTLARELEADVYTTNIGQENIEKMGFGDVLPRIQSIGRIPLNAPFRQQLALLRFRLLNLSGKYDFFIIAGDWAISGAAQNHPNLWYVHSPIRELWDLSTYIRNTLVTPWKRPLFDIWVSVNRWLNTGYVQKADVIACNSRTTQRRLKKYLDTSATVIYPPVGTSALVHKKNGNYWLSVNRLISHKRIEMQMEAFSQLPEEKLVIVGSYEQSEHFQAYAHFCQRIQPKNVEIRSWVSTEELRTLYANCKGFISTSIDEDFGMNAVEAMAAGKPVIAPAEGGYQETVIDGKTGTLIINITSEKLARAIRAMGPYVRNYKQACLARAKKFDTAVFIGKIRQLISYHNKSVS